MRCIATLERAVEVARAYRVQLVGQLVGQWAALDQRQRTPTLPDHVGVRRRVYAHPGLPFRRWLTEPAGRVRRADGTGGGPPPAPPPPPPPRVHRHRIQ